MMLSEITAAAGAGKRRKRVGRGEGSGHGKTCTRGNKGCNSRAGGGTRPLHEGGQMPIFRRLPKRGFSNVNFARRYEVVNLAELESTFRDGETVNSETLQERHLIDGSEPRIKILGYGEFARKLTVVADAFSAAARAAIEKAGGQVQVTAGATPAEKWRAKRNVKARERRAKKAASKGAAAPSGAGKAEKAAPEAPPAPAESADQE